MESAGLAPEFMGAQDDAIDVLKENYQIDISKHRTKDITNLELHDYDWIIVLDAYVYNQLVIRYSWISQDLLLWDIKDPYLQEKKAYAVCAETIRRHIQKYLL